MKLDKNHTMVYLDADKQTYADLNVTGNVYGEQALCSLFLKAETKKGKSLMLDWIRHIQALQTMILKLNSWSIFRAGSSFK